MELKNKVVVITGAGRGLGKSLALILAEEGARLVLSGKDKEHLENLKKGIGGKIFSADITDENQVKELAKFAIKEFGRIDIWINNAGVWLPEVSIEEIDFKRVHDMFEVNVFGGMYGSREALKQMRKQGSGIILNIISTAALDGRKDLSGYIASKFAFNGFTKSLRDETKRENLKILSVFPGGMKTSIFDEKRPSNFDEFMDPNEVAQKIVDNLKKDKPEEEMVIRRN